MAFYHVALSFTRPPNYDDAAIVIFLREVINQAACLAIDVTPEGFVIECDPAGLELLETTLRTKLGARGGSLDRMTARRL